jgi:hypothetical protein
MTALMMFNTIFWWVAQRRVWFFALLRPPSSFSAPSFHDRTADPFARGSFLGGVSHRPTPPHRPYSVVIFSPLVTCLGGKAFCRISLQPAINFVSGLAPMLFLGMSLNYMRFDDPLETGYGYTEQMHQAELQFVYPHGLFDISYVERHPPVLLGQMPIFQDSGPYILPSWAGMAIWATTPPFFYAFFTTLKKFLWVVVGGGALLSLAAFFILSKGVARAWDGSWATTDVPLGLSMHPSG